MRKRILSAITVMTAMLALTACGGSSTGETAAAVETQAGAAETQATVAEAAEVAEETESTETASETVTITSLDGNGEEIQLEVPYNPERIAILDMASLDILDSLGVGEKVVGMASTSLEYLQTYAENEDLAALGTIKEADLEAVMACEPDVIFIGGRLASAYDSLSQIAPVVYLATDTESGVVESVRSNAETIASMFGKEAEVGELMSGFDERIQALADFASGKTAIVGMCTSGSFNIWETMGDAPSLAGRSALTMWV